ncbi:hypothetical protein ACE6H2_006684 [Prunus campanulata]
MEIESLWFSVGNRIFGEDCRTFEVNQSRTKDIVAATVRGFNEFSGPSWFRISCKNRCQRCPAQRGFPYE